MKFNLVINNNYKEDLIQQSVNRIKKVGKANTAQFKKACEREISSLVQAGINSRDILEAFKKAGIIKLYSQLHIYEDGSQDIEIEF